MKKQILSLVAFCAFISVYAKVDERFYPENMGNQIINGKFWSYAFMFTQWQDAYATRKLTLDKLQEIIETEFDVFKNISQYNAMQASMLQQELELLKYAVVEVAKATRSNTLPALDEKLVQKGVDVQAARLKAIELIEEAVAALN
jgi:hypothetical protein